MLTLATAIILTTIKRHQAAFLPRFWVAEKTAYVLEDRKSGGVDVWKYVETARGVEQTGAVVHVRDFVVGSGPGLGDSLLLLCRANGSSFKLLRLSKNSIHKVCYVRSFKERVDPQVTITETPGCIELQDPTTEGDNISLRIWLYSGAWAGPLLTSFGYQREPINSREMFSYSDVAPLKDPMWNVRLTNPSEGLFERNYVLLGKNIKLSGETPETVVPLKSLPANRLSLIAQTQRNGWIVQISPTNFIPASYNLEIWQQQGMNLIGATNGRGKPVFIDTRGRVWVLPKGHVFQKLNLKLVRKDKQKMGFPSSQ